MSIPVYIAVYKPLEGNYLHWSLYVDVSKEKKHIYEVVGAHPEFTFSHLTTNPNLSLRHRENILVGYIEPKDMEMLESKLRDVKIDNENPGWTCQDWVLEALEELCEDYVLDANDEDYEQGVQMAKRKYFGPL